MVPPSLTAGSKIKDPGRNEPITQISIGYQLRVVLKFWIPGRTELSEISVLGRVEVLPLTEVQPPTNTQHFPTEFVESVSHAIQSSILGFTLGTMTISTQEPPALSFQAPFSDSSTTLRFQVELDAAESSEIYHRLRHLAFSISGVLRIKTFFTTTTFPELPSQVMLATFGKTRLLDEVMKLESRKIGSLDWQYRSRDKTGSWRTTISVPIHLISRVPPTFCSPLVARFYSLVMRLKVLSASSNNAFELEVPIQVVYPPTQLEQATASSPAQSRPPNVEYLLAAEPDSTWDERHIVSISSFNRDGLTDQCG